MNQPEIIVVEALVSCVSSEIESSVIAQSLTFQLHIIIIIIIIIHSFIHFIYFYLPDKNKNHIKSSRNTQA